MQTQWILKNLLIDTWKWDWDFLMTSALWRKGMFLHSAKPWFQLRVAMTPGWEMTTAPCTLQDWSPFFPPTLGGSLPLHTLQFSSKMKSAPGMESVCHWRMHPRAASTLLCRFSQCACPWKGFMQTSYQRLSHPSILFFLTKQFKTYFHLCNLH